MKSKPRTYIIRVLYSLEHIFSTMQILVRVVYLRQTFVVAPNIQSAAVASNLQNFVMARGLCTDVIALAYEEKRTLSANNDGKLYDEVHWMLTNFTLNTPTTTIATSALKLRF